MNEPISGPGGLGGAWARGALARLRVERALFAVVAVSLMGAVGCGGTQSPADRGEAGAASEGGLTTADGTAVETLGAEEAESVTEESSAARQTEPAPTAPGPRPSAEVLRQWDCRARPTTQCVTAYDCALSCSERPFYVGCCPCPEGTVLLSSCDPQGEESER